MSWITVVFVALLFYLMVSLYLTYLVHRIPRRPVKDVPDWGSLTDTRIPSADGGFLEVWKVVPREKPRGTVLLAHGWSRNRDRMTARARMFGEMGFTTVMHSARDHGGSSPLTFANAPRFAEDLEQVIQWIREPVILYGHSLGAAASLIAITKNPESVNMLILEGCYARTKEALGSLYRNYNPLFGVLFAQAVIMWLNLFSGFMLERVSPVVLAKGVSVPVLIVHGEKDKSFPLNHAWRLRDSFRPGLAELFVARGADHSSSSLAPGYRQALESFVERHFPEVH